MKNSKPNVTLVHSSLVNGTYLPSDRNNEKGLYDPLKAKYCRCLEY